MPAAKKGRPRSEASKVAVLGAAFAILRERGYSSMSIESVAARAKASKATIYRWWADRQALTVDAFFTATITELALPDTGQASEDFRQQIQQLAALLRGETGEVMAAMIEGARHDLVLRQAIGLRWVLPLKKWGTARMQKAIQAGE